LASPSSQGFQYISLISSGLENRKKGGKSMAVVSTPMDSVFVAQYQTGLSGTGSPITRQKSFTGIKTSAVDQDIYDVASALFGLLEYPLVAVRRDDRFDLVNQ
jgi:hypothetical protein